MPTQATGFSNQGAPTMEQKGPDIPIQKGVASSEITKELPSGQSRTKQNIVLETLTITQEEAREALLQKNAPLTLSPRRVIFLPCPSPGFIRSNESPTLGPSPSKSRSTTITFLPKLSFKFRNTTSDIEKAAVLALDGSAAVAPKKPFLSWTLSRMKSREKVYPTMASKNGLQLPIHRSWSVPALTKEGNATFGGMFRIVRSIPQLNEKTATTTFTTDETVVESEDGGEDIPEEEAVCRICMVDLGEGTDTFKLECSCKGELSLAHRECVVKWFGIKGNRTCDVCKQEVQNLPVILFRVHEANLQETSQYRVWQDAPILVIVNMLAYFCFLEKLLVSNMGSRAMAMSLPFSCIVGLLASMAALTMVRRKRVWVYATVQFGLVQFGLMVLLGHLLYSLAHIQAVIAILLATFAGFEATFAGFGAVMCGISILMEILNSRRKRLAQLNQHGMSQDAVPPDESSAATHQAPIDSQHTEINVENSPRQVC